MPSLISADQTLIDQQIRSERESDFDSNSAYGEVIDNSVEILLSSTVLLHLHELLLQSPHTVYFFLLCNFLLPILPQAQL